MKLRELAKRVKGGEKLAHSALIEERRAGIPGGLDRRVVLLDHKAGGRVVLGRAQQADIRIRSTKASSRHAVVEPGQGEGTWQIIDLVSTNGTKINGKALEPNKPRPLEAGLELLFGTEARFTFLDAGGLKALVAQSIAQCDAEAKTAAAADAAPAKAPRETKRASGRAPAQSPAKPGKSKGPGQTPPASRRPTSGRAPARPTSGRAPAQPASGRAPARPTSGRAPAQPAAQAEPPRPSVDVLPGSLPELLAEARAQNASDLHLLTGSPPVMRLNGELLRGREPVFSQSDLQKIILEMTNATQREMLKSSGDLDLCCAIGDERYRVNVCIHREGLAVSFRLVASRIPGLVELGIPDSASALTDFAQGLVLITGPLGAGKTTTMLSLVDLVNRSRLDHIITIEDPIECLIEPVKCQISQRELHTHTRSFGAALRGALREDPDIIMIGDLRDYDTAHLAIAAAETGHLVFASMATMNATKSIEKLIDLFPADEQAATRTMLSESLRGILCQHLLPGRDGTRVPAVELVFNSIAVANIIREGKTSNLKNAMQMGRAQGMRSLEASLEALVKSERITQEVADATLRG